jgi:hypothetical protein
MVVRAPTSILLVLLTLAAGCDLRQTLRCSFTNVDKDLRSSDALRLGEASECLLKSSKVEIAQHLPLLLTHINNVTVYRTVQYGGGISFGEAGPREISVSQVALRAIREAAPIEANLQPITQTLIGAANAMRDARYLGEYGDPSTNAVALTELLIEYHRAGLGPQIAAVLQKELPKIGNPALVNDAYFMLELRALSKGELLKGPVDTISSVRPVILPGKHGLTWGLKAATQEMSFIAHCHGEPKSSMDQLHNGSCDPYVGDTACGASLPVLCFNPTSRSLALTKAIVGSELRSADSANTVCAGEFGANWRMAEHHDGDWGIAGNGLPPKDATRFWVAINDQPGNCWN